MKFEPREHLLVKMTLTFRMTNHSQSVWLSFDTSHLRCSDAKLESFFQHGTPPFKFPPLLLQLAHYEAAHGTTA